MNAAHGTRRVSFSGRPLLLADVHSADADGVRHGGRKSDGVDNVHGIDRQCGVDGDGGDRRDGGGIDRLCGVDVVLVDLNGVAPAAVQPMVAEAAASGHLVGGRGGSSGAVDAAVQRGVSLVVLDASWADSAIRSIVDTGVVVVLSANTPDVASARAIMLANAGVDLARVVFEVVIAQTAPVAAIGQTTGGHHAGVCLAPGDGSLSHDGWEIGMLTAVLSQGVATVRGVEPRRFRRVCAVLDALNGLEAVS